jgi:hypothetical protein
MVAVASLRKYVWVDANVDDIITTKIRGNKLKWEFTLLENRVSEFIGVLTKSC